MYRFAAILLLACMASVVKAQEPEYMLEIGAGGGMSWAYGDVNRSKLLYKPQAAYDLFLRYNANPRWSYVTEVASFGLKGDSRDFSNAFPGNGQYQFDNRLWQISFRPEFNFWNYGWANDYREKKRLAPFITTGFGIGFSSGDGETGVVMSIPFGIGTRWKMTQRLNAQLTCLFTRTLGDLADGINDPYRVESSALANSDWIGSLILSITFDFKERCFDCNKQ